MNIDDRPTTNDRPTSVLRANSHILQKFQMATTLQRVNWSPCLDLRWVFGDGGSNGAISVWTKSKMLASGHGENFKWPNILNALSDSLCACIHALYDDGDSKHILQRRVTSRPTAQRERTKTQILRNSRENNVRGVYMYIRLVTQSKVFLVVACFGLYDAGIFQISVCDSVRFGSF